MVYGDLNVIFQEVTIRTLLDTRTLMEPPLTIVILMVILHLTLPYAYQSASVGLLMCTFTLRHVIKSLERTFLLNTIFP